MGNSTITLQKILDRVAGKGIPTPLSNPSGYASDLALSFANDVMSDIIAERFNWKWNRAVATPFYTNSYQQDYPQIGLTDCAWLEDADRVDINNTSLPKPIRQLTCRRQLSSASVPYAPVDQICWMYNYQMQFGTWPGAAQTFYPLVTAQVKQNPIMSMKDANGNLLIVTTVGTTGTVAPVLPVNSAEGTAVVDGTVTWKVVSPNGQGFRVFPLPGATGPVLQIIAYYQKRSIAFLTLGQTIDPVPDDYSGTFQKGMDAYCLMASPNPGDGKRGMEARAAWLNAMLSDAKQGDRETDAYAIIPCSSPVDSVYSRLRNPQDPGEPF